MSGNVFAAMFNLVMFGVWMALGWYIAATVAVVCIAFSLSLAAMES